MSIFLPTTEQLERLPARAVVAYAVRAARLISMDLREVISENLLAESMQRSLSIATDEVVADLQPAIIFSASDRVAKAYIESTHEGKSPERLCFVISIVQASMTAINAIYLARNHPHSRHDMRRVAISAERVTRPIKLLSLDTRDDIEQATLNDYTILLNSFGEQADVILGEPVQCFGVTGP